MNLERAALVAAERGVPRACGDEPGIDIYLITQGPRSPRMRG